MAAVAVWEHKPSAEEILAARVARGWQPTPTSLKDGAKILGFAACLSETPVATETADKPSPSMESGT